LRPGRLWLLDPKARPAYWLVPRSEAFPVRQQALGFGLTGGAYLAITAVLTVYEPSSTDVRFCHDNSTIGSSRGSRYHGKHLLLLPA
jgi:hypothetical protein